MSDTLFNDILKKAFANHPSLMALFPRSPSYRYFSHCQHRYCWNTEPMGGEHPWRAFVYAPTGPGSRTGKAKSWKLVREVNCATRKSAKARALKWCQLAREKVKSDAD